MMQIISDIGVLIKHVSLLILPHKSIIKLWESQLPI